MVGLAALISKNGEDVSEPLTQMLRAMKHRGGDGYGVADKDGVFITSSLPKAEGASSTILLGCCNRKLLPNDLEQPLSQYGYALALDGKLYSFEIPDAFAAAEHLGRDPEKGIEQFLIETNGSYALVVLKDSHLLCARDPLGEVPLYLGESRRHFGVASERKALWSVGIENPTSLPPGHLVEITRQGVSMKPVKVLTQPEPHRLSEDEVAQRVGVLFLRAVDIRTRDVERVALGFSGGLDSSLLAYITNACGVEVDLISVGVKGSREIEDAVEAAESLGLPYYAQLYGEDEVEETLDAALLYVEEPDQLKVEIAMPLLWVAEKAVELGDRVLLLGQGCDELFGGYKKYSDEYLKEGAEAAQSLMFREVSEACRKNYEPANKVSAYHGVELRLPFADWELTQFVLSLPVELKLSPENSLGKKVLRRLAESLELPSTITTRRKRAIQYSTGVDKALRRIAKKRGLTLTSLLQRRFTKVLSRYNLSK